MAKFTSTTRIVSGNLINGQTVEMETTLTDTKTGKQRMSRSSGVFVGDYRETKAWGGEVHFMFRDGIIGDTPQPHFACPVSRFDTDTLAAYGDFKFDAQAIHENA